MNGINLLGAFASAFIIGYMWGVYEPAEIVGKAEAKEFAGIDYTYYTDIDTNLKVIPRIDLTLNDVVDERDKHCLIENVYFEARGEPLIGQEAVVWVTLNRVMSGKYPDSICDVVRQPKQFSWTSNLSASKSTMKTEEWLIATNIVEDVLLNYYTGNDPTEGSMFFHATSVSPHWADSFEKVVRINNHVFYKDNT